jgi:uncharacterized protein (DUF1501 family)
MNPKQSISVDRRHFLKWSTVSLTALGVGMPIFLQRAVATGSLSPTKKVLFIFLRGGIDGIQTVIPYGDAGNPSQGMLTYSEARPTLGAASADAHDLNGFASLYPDMQSDDPHGPKMADIFHNSIDGRGQNLALVHRVGYENQNQSHFSGQQFLENGVPGDVLLEEGVFNRYLSAYADPTAPLQGAVLNTKPIVLMKGKSVLPVLRSVDDYRLPKIGAAPNESDPLGAGLLGGYGQTGFDAVRAHETLTYTTGKTLLEELQFFEDEVYNTDYEPDDNAQPFYDAIEDRTFAGFVGDCARLLKQVEGAQIVGCNQDGYDTHGSQNIAIPNARQRPGAGVYGALSRPQKHQAGRRRYHHVRVRQDVARER